MFNDIVKKTNNEDTGEKKITKCSLLNMPDLKGLICIFVAQPANKSKIGNGKLDLGCCLQS